MYVRGDGESMCERRGRDGMSFISHRCGRCVLECCFCCTHVPTLLMAGDVQLVLLTLDSVRSIVSCAAVDVEAVAQDMAQDRGVSGRGYTHHAHHQGTTL